MHTFAGITRVRLVAGWAMALLAVFAATAGLALRGAAHSAAATDCVAPSWHIVANPNVLQHENAFTAVAAIAPNDAWAAGWSGTQGQSRTRLQHWDGAHWTMVPSPNPSSTWNQLFALAARASDDVWAGGYSVQGNTWQSLLLHWDGRAWSVVPSPNPGSGMNALYDLAIVAHDDVWAVGTAGNVQAAPGTSRYTAGQTQPLALHWDGATWQSVTMPPAFPAPAPTSGYRFGTLERLAVVSAGDIWTVGGISDYTTNPDGAERPLAMHWDGTVWRAAPTPALPTGGGLFALAAGSPQDVWAGGGVLKCHVCEGALLAHYDGQAWQTIPSPEIGPVNSLLRLSANDLWAGGTGGLLHGDGRTWTYGPQPLADAVLGGSAKGWRLAGTSTHDLWAVAENRATGWTVAAHYGCAPTTPAVPGTATQTFPATGQAAAGLYLDYWRSHGGLAQQGYPIAAPLGELSDLNGHPYTVQYFERAVMEYHPENAAPYNVLLSQLGKFQFQRKYAARTPSQHADQANGHYFPETGHWVGGRFWPYWQQHGGLAQQGYPLSDEFTEVSDLNGKPYTVQYFERAVFELHPENAPPYDVLLSQLGTVRYREKYGSP